MPATANISLIGSATDSPIGDIDISESFSSPSSPGTMQSLVLASGVNTVQVPAGTRAVIITLPRTNAVATMLMGAYGDAGLALNPAGWIVLQLASTQISFVLTSAAAQADTTVIGFF